MTGFRPWQVLHVQLRETIPDLEPRDGLGGFRVVFWAGEIALGHHDVPAECLPLRAPALRAAALRSVAPALGRHLLQNGFAPPLPMPPRLQPAAAPPDLARLLDLSRPLERLRRELPGPVDVGAAADTSVVVCTRERPEALARCLSSLATLAPAAGEIVVVDNAPRSDATRRVVERHPAVRYVAEPRPGLSVARNTGIRAGRGGIVAFTDDDVTVTPGWLAGLLRGFRDPATLAVTGLVLPTSLDTPARLAFEFQGGSWGYRGVDYGPEFFAAMRRRGVPAWRIGAGANMAFRRRAFEEVGLFDERLGAGASGCSEDSELWYRVLAAGRRCRYEPAAVVFHEHRAGWDELRSQMFLYMRGHVVALLIQATRHRHAGNLYRLLVALPLYYSRKTASRMLGFSKRGALPLRPQLLGCVAGVGWWLRHARRPAFSAPSAADSAARA